MTRKQIYIYADRINQVIVEAEVKLSQSETEEKCLTLIGLRFVETECES